MDEIRRIRKREEVPREETWATEDIFPDDAAWEAEFKAVKEELKGYGDFKGRLGASAGALYGVLRFDAMIGERLDRLYSYAHLNSDADTNNQKYQQMVGKAAGLCAAASAASAYIPSEILAIPEDQLDALRASEEADREFDISLDEVLRKKAHTRSPEVEELLADASEMAGGPSRIFQMFNNADTRFPAIPNEEGQLEELTHGRYIRFLESGNRNVRRAAFKAMYETFGRHKNTLAAAFQANVKQAWFYAKARRYPSSRTFYMDDADVPEQALSPGCRVDVAFCPQVNEFRGLRSVQLQVLDLRPAPSRAQLERSIYEKFRRGEVLSPREAQFLLPSRGEFAQLWRWLEHQSAGGGPVEDTLVRITRGAARRGGRQEVPARTMLCLEVFQERGLIDLREHTGRMQITIRRQEHKVDLEASDILRRLRRALEENSGSIGCSE